jgi:nucleoside 2-deoxyribosyltransferase
MRVYFAHPCFDKEQQQFKEEFLRRLRERIDIAEGGDRIAIIDPFDHAPNVEHSLEEKLRMSTEIKTACLELLQGCQVIMALVDWNDTGTAFEAGYAHSLNIPLVLISRTTCSLANAMLLGAAHARCDNILEEKQMGILADMLKAMAGNTAGRPC